MGLWQTRFCTEQRAFSSIFSFITSRYNPRETLVSMLGLQMQTESSTNIANCQFRVYLCNFKRNMIAPNETSYNICVLRAIELPSFGSIVMGSSSLLTIIIFSLSTRAFTIHSQSSLFTGKLVFTWSALRPYMPLLPPPHMKPNLLTQQSVAMGLSQTPSRPQSRHSRPLNIRRTSPHLANTGGSDISQRGRGRYLSRICKLKVRGR